MSKRAGHRSRAQGRGGTWERGKVGTGGANSPLKKGTGSEPNPLASSRNALARGACPLFQRTAKRRAPIAGIRRALLAWYRRSARDLPWRRTRDPYRIWLSEILLQQTRVETALPYYERFIEAFRTVARLAAAPLNRVLMVWAGLGYYRRARNLHRAARVITHERGGRFPRTAAEWTELPGVGRYTAGAVASITASEPVAAVDGNAKRVLARLFSIRMSIDDAATQADLWRLAEALLSRTAPGDSNQALMELGARICTPRRPRCSECPVRRHCAGYAAGEQEHLPLRGRKRMVPQVEAVAAAIQHRGRYLVVQRPPVGLLAGYWTLPGGEIEDGDSPADALPAIVRSSLGLEIAVGCLLGTVQHVFSHRRLTVYVHACSWLHDGGHARRNGAVRWLSVLDLPSLPLAAIDRKLLAVATGREHGPRDVTPSLPRS